MILTARTVYHCALLILLSVTASGQLAEGDLFDFGADAGDEILPFPDDSSSPRIVLRQPISYFGRERTDAFVNQNGHVSFGEQFHAYHNKRLAELQIPLIAIFYADVDTRDYGDPTKGHGAVYYREESTDAATLGRATSLVGGAFADADSFEAAAVLLATWHDVGYFDGRADRRSTFQLAIASNDSSSYALLLYGQLQWVRSEGKFPQLPDLPAQAGFVAGDGAHQTLIASGTDHFREINRLTNVNEAGIFIFRISGVSPIDPRDSSDANEIDDEGDEDLDEYYSTVTDDEWGSNRVNADGTQNEDDELYYDDEYVEPLECADDSGDCPPECVLHSQQGCTACYCPEPLDPPSTRLNTDGAAAMATSEHDQAAHSADGHNSQEALAGRTAAAPGSETVEAREVQSAPPLIRATSAPSCDQVGDSFCHANASCVARCCQCRPGFYGNGIECLEQGVPQRINGGFSGRLNGRQIESTELHTYAVASDGRSYTALSQIAPELGPSLLLLNTIGGVMGWLFAKTQAHNVHNGFMLTGGVFNRTATVHIGEHTVTINQEFSGKDIFHYLKAKVYIAGTLPEIPSGAEVTYGEYSVQYRHEAPGYIKSYSTRTAQVNGRDYPITIDQQIRYKPCPFAAEFDASETTIRVERNYVVYEPVEKIVRYASGNLAQSGSGSGAAACLPGVCRGVHQRCEPVDRSYRCVCDGGYEMNYDNRLDTDGACVDVDECAQRSDRCAADADCYNTDGAYTCECRQGFHGTGYECARSDTEPHEPRLCGGYLCSERAECLPTVDGGAECVCRVGFEGDGVSCEALPGTGSGAQHTGPMCRAHDFCHLERGHCTYNDELGYYQCQCRAPYVGDGKYTCEMADSETTVRPTVTVSVGGGGGGVTDAPQICRSHEECSEFGECAYSSQLGFYRCVCRSPYAGDGRTCTHSQGGCDYLNNCDPNADCVYEQNEFGGGYVCRCREGFSGNGHSCAPTQPPTTQDCSTFANCHPQAQCVFDQGLQKHVCQCLLGFDGDGYTCTPEGPMGPPCTDQDDCHVYGHCVTGDPAGTFFCECLPGYRGDGRNGCDRIEECRVTDPRTCGDHERCDYDERQHAYLCACVEGFEQRDGRCQPVPTQRSCRDHPHMCHANAQCVLNDDLALYQCICRPGSFGDGRSRCDVVETPRCRNCSRDADCVQDSTGFYECECRDGFSGNGILCTAIVTCLEKREICDLNAVCVPGRDGSYVCSCEVGFHGNGLTCQPDSQLRGRTIVVGQGASLIERGVAADVPGKQLVTIPHQVAVGIDFDCRSERLVWSDVSGHALRTMALDGTNWTELLGGAALSSPEGVAVDWSSGNVYYVDSIKDVLGVVSLATGKHRELLSDGLVNPRALAIDVVGGYVYYSDWFRVRPIIGRVSLDGQDRSEFVNEHVDLPNGLTLLHARQELCWVDAGQQRLSCQRLDGGGRRVVYAPLEYPFGLTHHNEQRFYWTDWKDNRIHTVSVLGEAYNSFPASLRTNEKLYGIVSVPESCPPGETACAQNNGGCASLCLPTRDGGVSCVDAADDDDETAEEEAS